MVWFRIVMCLIYFSGVYCDLPKRPTNLPCKIEDVKCITGLVHWLYATTIPGVPELGLESLDPIHYEHLEGSLPYVKYNLMKTDITGFKTCKIRQASVSSDLSNMRLEFLCRRIHLDGEYNIDGKILHFPIIGEGTFYVDTKKYYVAVDIELKFYNKNGISHVMFKSFKYNAELLGELDLELRNLFQGNKELSELFHSFAKQNGKLVVSLLHDPLLVNNIKIIFNHVNKRFGVIPVKDIIQI